MTHDVRIPLLVVGLVGIIAAARIASRPLVAAELPDRSGATSSENLRGTPRRMAAESIAIVVARDPFRLMRRPLLPAYDPLRVAVQQAPPAPRPQLVLVGVIDGVEPSAVIEGIPGADGSRVMRTGDVVSGLTVKKIAGGRVTIVGTDTTWVLEVKEPWKN